MTAADVAVGALTVALVLTREAAERVATMARATGPAVGWIARPPLVPPALQPATWVDRLARIGFAQRRTLTTQAGLRLDDLVPAVLAVVLPRADLTAVVNRYVDLDAVIAKVDVNAVAGTLDLDSLAQRIDVEAIINRLDLTAIVADNVDLDGLVVGVDVDAIASRLDIEAVLARVDMVGIAENVLDAINLPEIIREASGSVASETVRGARMQGIAADEAVSRAVNRMLLRRKRHIATASLDSPVADQNEPPA